MHTPPDNPPPDNIVFFSPPPKPRPEPVFNLPPVTQRLGFILAAGFVIFSYALPFLLGEDKSFDIFYALSFVSARYTGTDPLTLAAVTAPVTHMFLHGGVLHLVMNILSLMAFGGALEKMTDGRTLLLIALTSGLAGAATQLIVSPLSDAPMIGASGAISGIFGALLLLMNKRRMMGEGAKGLRIFVILWIVTSVFFGLAGLPGVSGNLAWATHIGGFLTGLATMSFLVKKNR